MRTIIVILSIFCATVCSAQVQQGYYTAPDMVAHTVRIKNGKIYIEAGGETAIYSNNGGKYVLQGYFYGGNEGNMRAPVSKNPPFIVPQTSTSYKYCTRGYEILYRLDTEKSKQFEHTYDTANLEEKSGDVQSEFVEVALKRVEEIAPNYEKYMQKSKDDPNNAQVWLQVAHATVLVSSYQGRDDATLNDLLLVKAKYIQRIAPYMTENPCPEVIPQEIWDKAQE